jgi:hypothetical protein
MATYKAIQGKRAKQAGTRNEQQGKLRAKVILSSQHKMMTPQKRMYSIKRKVS